MAKRKKGRGKRAKRDKKRRRDRTPKGPPIAEGVERHALYEAAVQRIDVDIEFMSTVYRERRSREALTLREDFCGTAQLARQWCLSDPERRATGIDNDPEVLDWGRQHTWGPSAEELGDRLTVVEADALEADVGVGDGPEAPGHFDLVCAMNFSYCAFHERATLARYFSRARQALAEGGLLVLDLYGGTEAIDELEEEPRRVDGPEGLEFDYVWEQESFDPSTARTVCHIHFRFDDRSSIEKAYTYDWRLWTAPELRDLLLEVGYSRVGILFEKLVEDEDEDDLLVGSGEFAEMEPAEQCDSWLAYVVAER